MHAKAPALKSQQAECFRFNPKKQIKSHHSILILHPDDRLAAQIVTKCIRHLPCTQSIILTNSKKQFDSFFPYPTQDASRVLNSDFLSKIWKQQGALDAKSIDKDSLSDLQLDVLDSTTDSKTQHEIMKTLQPKFSFHQSDLEQILGKIPKELVQLVNRYSEIPTTQLIIHHYFSPLVSVAVSQKTVSQKNESKNVGQKINSSAKQFKWAAGTAWKSCMTNCDESHNLLRILSVSGTRHKMPSPSVCKSFDYIFIFDREPSVAKTICRIFAPLIAAQTPADKPHIMPSADALLGLLSQLGPREGFVLAMCESPPKMYWTSDILRLTNV